jgi:hypothetical protein
MKGMGAIMPSTIVEPNLFDLTDSDELKISYSTTSFIGEPQLHYQDENHNLSFTGNEITTVPTLIGTLVTVRVEHIPDEKIVMFTLLLPRINVGDQGEIEFKTLGIETTDRSSAFVGPTFAIGALQTYRRRKLKGVAQRVDF